MRTALNNLFAHTSFRLCLLLWLFGYVLVDLSATLQGRGTFLDMFLTDLPLFFVAVSLSMLLAHLLDRLDRVHVLMKAAALAVAVIVAGAVQTFIDLFLMRAFALMINSDWSWALDLSVQRVSVVYILYTWTFSLVVALIWATRSNEAARVNEARARAFEAAASRAEAAALRLQLNPHFLFNTLNGIASLVVRGQQVEAEEMLARLATFLRASLAADPAALIPLRQELATVRAYLHVEQARLGDRMRLSYAVDDAALDALVPNFIMQPLVENALKHGVRQSRRGAKVNVAARLENGCILITVANFPIGPTHAVAPAAGASEDRRVAGIGLANTRQRLQSIYGDDAWVRTSVLDNGYECELGLPAQYEVAVEAAE